MSPHSAHEIVGQYLPKVAGFQPTTGRIQKSIILDVAVQEFPITKCTSNPSLAKGSAWMTAGLALSNWTYHNQRGKHQFPIVSWTDSLHFNVPHLEASGSATKITSLVHQVRLWTIGRLQKKVKRNAWLIDISLSLQKDSEKGFTPTVTIYCFMYWVFCKILMLTMEKCL